MSPVRWFVKVGLRLVNVLAALKLVALGAQVVHPGAHVVWKQQSDAVTRQRALKCAQQWVCWVTATRVGAGVGVTKERRVESQLANLLRQIGVALVQGRAIASGTVVHQVKTGLQARARGATGRGDREMMLEKCAVSCQCVQVGCSDHRVPQRRQALATPLICRNE